MFVETLPLTIYVYSLKNKPHKNQPLRAAFRFGPGFARHQAGQRFKFDPAVTGGSQHAEDVAAMPWPPESPGSSCRGGWLRWRRGAASPRSSWGCHLPLVFFLASAATLPVTPNDTCKSPVPREIPAFMLASAFLTSLTWIVVIRALINQQREAARRSPVARRDRGGAGGARCAPGRPPPHSQGHPDPLVAGTGRDIPLAPSLPTPRPPEHSWGATEERLHLFPNPTLSPTAAARLQKGTRPRGEQSAARRVVAGERLNNARGGMPRRVCGDELEVGSTSPLTP